MNLSNQKILPLSIAPVLPKAFISGPLFPAKKQTKPRIITVGKEKWTIGADHPTKRRSSPALDIRHLRACATLLSFRDNGYMPQILTPLDTRVHFSMNEFCTRYANSQGGKYSTSLLNIIYDLDDTNIERELEDGTIERFTIIEGIKSSDKIIRRKDALAALSKQYELWLDYVTLNVDFFNLLADTARIRLDILNEIDTPLAQSIYSYIPSRAVHRSKNNPFENTATNLLTDLGESVPSEKKARRAKFANKRDGRKPILEQLDGRKIINGTLRADIVEIKDDWKLQFWAEDVKENVSTFPKITDSKSKLLNGFMASGRGDQREFNRIVKDRVPLSDYEVELLDSAGVNYRGNEKFLEMVRLIIGAEYFQITLAELKGNVLEPNRNIKNSTAVLIHRLMKAVNPN